VSLLSVINKSVIVKNSAVSFLFELIYPKTIAYKRINQCQDLLCSSTAKHRRETAR